MLERYFMHQMKSIAHCSGTRLSVFKLIGESKEDGVGGKGTQRVSVSCFQSFVLNKAGDRSF